MSTFVINSTKKRPSKGQRRLWTKQERLRFLRTIKKYGVLDMDRLREAVPLRNDLQIKGYLTDCAKIARGELSLKEELKCSLNGIKPKEKKQHYGCVDNWLEIIENYFLAFDDYKRLPIARAFLMISKYEQHPDPSECGGVDFKAMYEFLYCMLRGFPAKDLNPPTAKYVLESLSDLALGLKEKFPACEVNLLNSIKEVKCPEFESAKDNVIEGSLSKSFEDCFADFLKIPACNPLGIPTEYL